MRILLLLSFLACVNGSLASGKLTEAIESALSNIKTTLNKHRLLAIREKIHSLQSKIIPQITPNKEREALLEETLKKVKTMKKDHINNMGDTITEINDRVEISDLLYQGDIVLSNEQAEELIEEVENEGNKAVRERRQAFKDRNYPNTIWSKGVFFSFHNASSKVKSVFRKGAMEWQRDTCINFYEGNAPERIEVIVEDGCWSYVGNLHRKQHLSLGKGCETIGTAAHEIGHALGLFHTHSRHDRDRYIMLNTANIKRDWLDQFAKETTATNDNYGLTYDYGSIMHYGATSATYTGQPSMVPFDGKYIETLGSPFVSFYELLMLNTHYNCLDKCKSDRSAAKCNNGGFPHSRDCSKCVCPSGYGGRLCDEKPSGCGSILDATSEYKTLKDTVGNRYLGVTEREDFVKCYYWIQAPRGRKVEVKFGSFTNGVAIDGCTYAGVEIKTHADQRLTGYRFCSPDDAGLRLISSSNIVPVITYNRIYETTTVLEYRMV